jgi:hypothetical protein
LEVETTCDAIDIEDFASEIKTWMGFALKGLGGNIT